MDELTREVSQALRSAARCMGTYVPKSEWQDVLHDAIVASIERVDALPADAPGCVVPAVTYRACQDVLRRWITQRQRTAQMPDAYWERQSVTPPETEDSWGFLDSLPAAYRAVAICLAEGDSERQVADRLQTTRHQVRGQIGELRRILNQQTR